MAERPFHGGPDAGPVPEHDFSSNAVWNGPPQALLEALSEARPDLYPDPQYLALRTALGQGDASRIVVGAGAAELIFRSILSRPGPVLSFSPAFGEYHRCARALSRIPLEAASPEEFLERIPEQGCAFVCLPNNPDGRLPDTAFLAEVSRHCRARGTRLILDLAYGPLCEVPLELPEDADWMWAPNKPFSVTGVRAGWMRTADEEHAARLRPLAPAWCVGTQGVALLEWSLSPAAAAWLEAVREELWRDREAFALALEERGATVRRTAANWLLVKDPGNAWERLRERGLRVRDTGTMGLPGWLRLSVQSPDSTVALLGLWEELFPAPRNSSPSPRD